MEDFLNVFRQKRRKRALRSQKLQIRKKRVRKKSQNDQKRKLDYP